MTDVIAHIETDVRERILRHRRTSVPRNRVPEDRGRGHRQSPPHELGGYLPFILTPRSRSTQTSPIGSCGKWKRRSYHHAPTATERLHELPKPHIG